MSASVFDTRLSLNERRAWCSAFDHYHDINWHRSSEEEKTPQAIATIEYGWSIRETFTGSTDDLESVDWSLLTMPHWIILYFFAANYADRVGRWILMPTQEATAQQLADQLEVARNLRSIIAKLDACSSVQ